tara:strand:- start:1299 stop:1565 length:267 start_codon:yes stop_codon:yes gene_type:complete
MDNIYYTLLGLYRDDDNGHFVWEIIFGDYEYDIVVAEFDAYRTCSSNDSYQLRVIKTDDEQASIDAKVAELNDENFQLNQTASLLSSH